MPDYGMGFDVDVDLAPPSVEPDVETDDWTTPRTPPAQVGPSGPTAFIDGVRRAEVRLVADQDGQRGFGLFGSYAVGAVRCDARAEFTDQTVGRVIALGNALTPSETEVDCGQATLRFDPISEPGPEPEAPLLGLQTRMRDDESRLARAIADAEDCLVLCDGPLGFLELKRSPVVGVIKRFARPYLDPVRETLLRTLGAGQRTPVFGIDLDRRNRRYSWYLRLVALRPPWHDYAGLVRCEVTAAIGTRGAVGLANRVTSILPGFAGRPSDPRAPQNLAPVGGLETLLRHRMGDALLIRRSLLDYLCTVRP